MKKWKAAVCIFLWTLCLCAQALAGGGWAAVNNPNPEDRLNLRTEPSEQAVSLGKYYNGVTVQCLNIQNGWAEVNVEGRRGYMKADFLCFEGEGDGVQSAIPTVTVAAKRLNLRESPSNKGPILARFARGTEVEVLGAGTNWHHVRIGNLTGYMAAQYLSGDISFHGKRAETQAALVNNPNPEDRLNLRTAPDTKAPSLGKFYNGTPVRVLEKRIDGWCRVELGLGECVMSGYMRTTYLAFGDRRERVERAIKDRVSAVKTALEKTAGGADDVIYAVKQGEALSVWGDIGEEYCFCAVQGITGFFPRWAMEDAY